MLVIWDIHGPPPFVTLAVAHLDKKKRNKKKSKESASSTAGGEEKETGTMADLAAMFGLGGNKKKATI